MKPFFISLLFCFILLQSYGQSDSDWVMFIDKSTNLIGYKNPSGEIKIEPKFTYLTQQNIFRNIMPVYEKSSSKEDSIAQYYLLKDGREIGRDSLYLGEYFLDCENENKIRFRDPLTDKVGFFNNEGKVIIPAIYSDATSFYNGLAIALLNGKRMCGDGSEYSKENPCEHWNWEGQSILINENNEILLDSLDPGKFKNIDFYSLDVNPENKKADFVEFKSIDGEIYSFRDFDKEFRSWFLNDFLPMKKSPDFIDDFFPEITIPKEGDFTSKEISNEKYQDYAWTVDKRKNILEKNGPLILTILNKVNQKDLITSISSGHAPILLDDKVYKEYFSDCGDYLDKKHPYFEVIITDNNGLILNGLGFIRTNDGYKLVEIY